MADLFLDKNKDYVVAEHQDLLTASKCSFVAGLFPPSPEESSKTSKFSSIGTRFKVLLEPNYFALLFNSYRFCVWFLWFLNAGGKLMTKYVRSFDFIYPSKVSIWLAYEE